MIDTPQTWMARNAARLAVYALAAVVLVLAWINIQRWRQDAKEGAARIEARDATAGAATGITADMQTTSAEQQQVEVRIVTDTGRMFAQLETIRREKPDVDRWLDEPVPPELLQLARQRREARERSGDPGAGGRAAEPAP